MPSYTAIDYAAAFFPIPVLLRIVGKPTYEKLREMKKAMLPVYNQIWVVVHLDTLNLFSMMLYTIT